MRVVAEARACLDPGPRRAAPTWPYGGRLRRARGREIRQVFVTPFRLQLTVNKLPKPTLIVLVSKTGIRPPSS